MATTTKLVLRVTDIVEVGYGYNWFGSHALYLSKAGSFSAEYSQHGLVPVDGYDYISGATGFSISVYDSAGWIDYIEVGFTAFVDDLPFEFDLDNPPHKLFLDTGSNGPAGAVIQIGAYVDGVYGVLGTSVSTVGMPDQSFEIYLSSITMEAPPTPKADGTVLSMFIGNVSHYGAGPLAVYTEKPPSQSDPTALYSSKVPLSQDWIGSVSSLSVESSDMPNWLTSIEVDFIPVVGGVNAPIDPLSPPASVFVETYNNDFPASFKVGAYVDGVYGVLGSSDNALRLDTGVTEVPLHPIKYSLDHSEYPFVIRVSQFDPFKDDLGWFAVYVEEAQGPYSESAIYESFDPIVVSYYNSGDGTINGFAGSQSSVLSDDGVLEIGFVPIKDGVPKPLSLSDMPVTVNVRAKSNYAGGIIEIGHYIGGSYTPLGSVSFDGVNDYGTTKSMVLRDPSAPRIVMRFIDYNYDDWINYVALFTVPKTEAGSEEVDPDDEYAYITMVYSSDRQIYDSGLFLDEESTEFVSAIEIPSDYDESTPPVDVDILPYVNSVAMPIDPYAPPAVIYAAFKDYIAGGTLQVGAILNGAFNLMGELVMPDPTPNYTVYTINLTAIEGGGDVKKPYWANLVQAKEYIDEVV